MAKSHATEKPLLGFHISKKKFAGLAIMFNTNLLAWIEKKSLEEGEKSKIRNVFPEPFDWFDHAGNFSNSIWLGAATSALAGAILERREGIDAKKSTKVMWAVGTLAVLGVNILFESKLGTNFMNNDEIKFTGDAIDVVYGVGAGSLGASIPVLRDANKTQQRFTIL